MSAHDDFKTLEKSRPAFDTSLEFKLTQVQNPEWVPGSGATTDEWKEHKKIEVDPYADGRPAFDNYKILISAITPRPIGFVSTVDKDGKENLAPFSYFALVNHDPPTFVVSVSEAFGQKDTSKNILETKELTISIISEWFLEAANYTSIAAPHGTNEWALSGLTKAPSSKVKPAHVAESAFSIEAVLVHNHEVFKKSAPSQKSSNVFIVEGVNFHISENVVNEGLNLVDIQKLKPVSRLGGVAYGRTVAGFELPSPAYTEEAVLKATEVSKQQA